MYLLICALPFTISLNFATIFLSTVYLIHHDEKVFLFEIVRNVVTISSQQIRNSLFVIVIERIFATIWFEKYRFSSKGSLFLWLSVFSYFWAILYTSYSASMPYIPAFRPFAMAPLWIMFATHFITFILCPVLYFLNQRMYKLFAYQINLQSRHQIFENIKVLKFIFPPILIYTILAPSGSALRLTTPQEFYNNVPYCSYLIFYNLGFLLIMIQQIFENRENTVFAKSATVATVTNAFGKQLPAVLTNDRYFQDLKQQWH
uniref:Uncharacterized protein n=1 Tax=Panagrolaimus sp. PS1159 TaxID=55785 RepID=A0AC35F8N1_9BILA